MSSQSFPRFGAPLVLYEFAVSTHEDMSMYGAESRIGQPLLLLLFGLPKLWVIAGSVKIRTNDKIKLASMPAKIGIYLFLKGVKEL